ncbi:MAG: hypothetical protein IAF94_15960 [Pirellulaceae bacterium]|nr:hypothetical protein [Pirellulaceae bacterium]
MIQSLPQPPMQSRLAPADSQSPVYYLAWRIRKRQPWRSEEFSSRFQAHGRYFALVERGWEAHMEKRQPAAF